METKKRQARGLMAGGTVKGRARVPPWLASVYGYWCEYMNACEIRTGTGISKSPEGGELNGDVRWSVRPFNRAREISIMARIPVV